MTDREQLKRQVCAAIDARRREIAGIGESIMSEPELGFKEHRTAARVAAVLEEVELCPARGLALTGVKAMLRGGRPGPTVALMGELDALVLPEHSRADPATGAAHACGHNAQIAGMLGAALGLAGSGVAPHLAGNLVFFAVPAEEYVEIDYRLDLVRRGQIGFLCGKAELVRLGYFDDVDMALMIHTASPESFDTQAGVAASSNGFLAKNIRFVGTASHAGLAPHKGVNALSAATLALGAIHAQRETFRDEDCIRVHPIITRGGDLVNIVPSLVRMETYVRGKTTAAILDAAHKVDRALAGAAMAMGCRVEIETVPGDLPLRNDPALASIFRENVRALLEEDVCRDLPHGGGSTDAGDLSQIMPVLHPMLRGAQGAVHSPDWHIADPEQGYVAPAKLLAMMAIDLLAADAAGARAVLAQSRPALSRRQYLEQQQALFRTEVVDGAAVSWAPRPRA